jgi:hypothetical protein
MADFFTSFMSGGLKAATNQMYTLAEERGKILDDLRPKVQETFTLLNNSTQKYSDIYKKVSKFDGGQAAFNYFFDRGDIDLSLSIDEAANAIMANANQIPKGYGAGDSISGQDRIAKSYESGVESINNYITSIGEKHKLGNKTADLFLKEGNPLLQGPTPVETLSQQMQVPVDTMAYTPGVLGGDINSMKNDLLMRSTMINAYMLNNYGKAATPDDLQNPELAAAAGTYSIPPSLMTLYNDAIGEKDIRQNIIIELVKGYAQNEGFLSNFKTDPNLSDEQNLRNNINNFLSIYQNIEPLISPATAGQQVLGYGQGGGQTVSPVDPVLLEIKNRLENAEEGSQEFIDAYTELKEYTGT